MKSPASEPGLSRWEWLSISSVFVFRVCALIELSFFWRIYCDFFSRSLLFPFAISFIASFVDHIIAFSLHWLAFFPRKVQIVQSAKSSRWRAKLEWCIPPNVACCFVWNSARIGQNLLNEVPVESSILYFGRHLQKWTSRHPREKLQCLYEVLIPNNLRKTSC